MRFSSRVPVGIVVASLAVIPARAATYYLSPTGSDLANGTSLVTPFATFTKAVSTAAPGDTILVRGGTFNLGSTLSIGTSKNGSAALPFTMAAYNNEVPVLNFATETFGSRGIQLNANFWNIKGLTVQKAGDNGMYVQGSNNTIDTCRFTGNQDSGLQISGSTTQHPSNNLIKNCDSFANYDPATHGENADGFAAKFRDIGAGNVFSGCRAYGNADDGWDTWEARYGVTFQNCWSFKNGFNTFGDSAWAGDGNGIKLGHDSGTHILQGMVIWGNRLNGVDVNGNATGIELPADPITHGVTVDNVTAWSNGAGGNGYNFNFDESFAHVLGNDIALAGGSGNANIFAGNDDLFNSWDGIGVTAADFQSFDDTIAMGPRQPDGSLPVSTFLHLAANSHLINAGVNVGLPYNGSAPDLGAFETGAPEPATLFLLVPAAAALLTRRRR